MKFKYIIVDRTAFVKGANSPAKIVCQNVPPSIYKAVYPLHLFSLNEFLEFMSAHGYNYQWKWQNGECIPLRQYLSHESIEDYGFLFKPLKKGE